MVQFYGKGGQFRPIDAGVEALNQQIRKDERVIRSMKEQAAATERRDEKLIAAIKRKNTLEQQQNEANQRLEDKSYRQRVEATERNARRERENANTKIDNIKREADDWASFSETASSILNQFVEKEKKKQDDEEWNRVYEKGDILRLDVLQLKLKERKLDLADTYLKEGGSVETATEISQPGYALTRSGNIAKQIKIASNQETIKKSWEEYLRSEGPKSLDELNEAYADFRELYLETHGLTEVKGNGINDLKHALLVHKSDTFQTQRRYELNLTSLNNINDNEQSFLSTAVIGDTPNQLGADVWQKSLKLQPVDNFNQMGGFVNVKNGIKDLLSNPKKIGDIDWYLDNFNTLPNKGQKARPWRMLFSDSELRDIKLARLKADTEARKQSQEALKNKNHAHKISITDYINDPNRNPENDSKFINSLEGLSKENRDDFNYLVQHEGLNIDVQQAKDDAYALVNDGLFFKDDYVNLPRELKSDPKLKKAYEELNVLSEVNWSPNKVDRHAKDILVNAVGAETYEAVTDPSLDLAKNRLHDIFFERVTPLLEGKTPAEVKKIASETWQKLDAEVAKGLTDKNSLWHYDDVGEGQGFTKFSTKDELDITPESTTEYSPRVNAYIPPLETIKSLVITNDNGESVHNLITSSIKEEAKRRDIPVSELLNKYGAMAKREGQIEDFKPFEPTPLEEYQEKAKSNPQANTHLKDAIKNINNTTDLYKTQIATINPRPVEFMTKSSQWCMNIGGSDLQTQETLQQHSPNLIQKYFKLDGTGLKGGATVVSKEKLPNGNKVIIQLPGDQEDEPKCIFFYTGANQ